MSTREITREFTPEEWKKVEMVKKLLEDGLKELEKQWDEFEDSLFDPPKETE